VQAGEGQAGRLQATAVHGLDLETGRRASGWLTNQPRRPLAPGHESAWNEGLRIRNHPLR
jgi:hypothetical protein